MKSNNIKVLFWIHTSKADKSGNAPIYLRISFGGQRKNISTGYKIDPSRWDRHRGQVKGMKQDAALINAYISQTKAKLMDLYNEMLRDQDLNLDKLIERFFGRDTSNITLLELVNYHNEDFKSRIGVDYTFSTFEKYDILRKKLENFLAFKYHRKDIRIRDLKVKFIDDFNYYLKTNDRNAHNTTAKYLKNLKKILNIAVINKWISENPFKAYRASYKEVERVYLTNTELKLIEKKEFRLQRLSLVKDLFLFQCYTGLSYSDMVRLTWKNVVPGIDGNRWLILRRLKTDVRAAIPLLPQADSILRKYAPIALCNDQPLFPTYCIQKFNSYLHEIASVCEINKNLTSHVGRRTFATTIALSNGVSLETISKILGHTSTRITSQYAVVTDHIISKDMMLLRKKLSVS